MKRTAAIILTVVLMMIMCMAASAATRPLPNAQPAANAKIAVVKKSKPEFQTKAGRNLSDPHPFLTEFLGPVKEAKKK